METLEQLKESVKNAPEGDISIFGDTYLDADNRFYSNGHWFGASGYIEIKQPTRSLSDINRIIELMEANKEAKKGALLSLKEAIEPDGLINSDAGLKTIKTIQNAIDEIVRHL